MPAPLHIITLVKWVPDSQLERRFTQENRLDRSEGILGELDEYPLEAALQIKESLTDREVRVSAVTVGPEGASAALKKALQLGADDGFRLTDDALAGADVWATSAAAAALVRTVRDQADFESDDDAEWLVLTGMASEDGESGAVPAQIGERLGIPALTQAVEIGLQAEHLVVSRISGGAIQKLDVALPAVVSVTDQANDPRYPNFKAIMAAKKKPVSAFDLADVGLAPAETVPKVELVNVRQRAARPAGQVVTDDGAGGKKIVDYLAKERLV
ncbi:electron transfer flavoprotein subunit beta/FixA family protein [Nesterenkonia populi]|uniref:electron transfer flavoprotein subunit beta/FixA family protein n=1 Tax=Nesterenkonia populi TaxID=1591087 RepID=UPI0011BDCF75|nr:electron transfer flavoprotein subunit beta/FixA family protein [Nesterenkonia populi]